MALQLASVDPALVKMEGDVTATSTHTHVHAVLVIQGNIVKHVSGFRDHSLLYVMFFT